MKITELKPQAIWTIFDEITKVPRPSKKEEMIRQYLKDWAVKNNIAVKEQIVPGYTLCRSTLVRAFVGRDIELFAEIAVWYFVFSHPEGVIYADYFLIMCHFYRPGRNEYGGQIIFLQGFVINAAAQAAPVAVKRFFKVF